MKIYEVFTIFLVGFCVNGAILTSCNNSKNQDKMIKLNLAHYDQKTGEFVLDSLSCHNDSCIIFRK
jgi:hypothetical protein